MDRYVPDTPSGYVQCRYIRQLSPEIQQLYDTFLSVGTYFLLKQWLIEGSQKPPKEIADIVPRIINKKVLL